MAQGFSHKAIYGQTGTGKSWLLKRRANLLLKHKQRVIAYSGVSDAGWPKGVKLAGDADTLENWLSDPKNYGAFIMIDEAAALYDEIGYAAKKHPILRGLLMRGRHKGYTVYLATQYPTSIPRRNRVNCQECFCFRLADSAAAQMVWKDYGCLNFEGRPLWESIVKLQNLEFFHLLGGNSVAKMRLK